MATQFSPQLIGQTEKTLNALLRQSLEGTGLTEPQWVTLRLASQLDALDASRLASAVADRAHLADSVELVLELTRRGLLADGRLTPAGRDLTMRVLTEIGERTAPIWDNLDASDVAATSRVLNEVLARAREILAEPISHS